MLEVKKWLYILGARLKEFAHARENLQIIYASFNVQSVK